MNSQRYKMTVAYDGSDFCGWQVQAPPDKPPLRTVQGVMQEVIGGVVGHPVNVQGASRTDSGVHALGQVAHFDAATRIPTERLAKAINSRLPDDVEVRSVEEVPITFHATYGAAEKQYRYRVWNGDGEPLHLRKQVYHNWVSLDVPAMEFAAAKLVGTRDFEGFSSAGHGRLDTTRTIFHCSVEHHRTPPPLVGDEVHIVVRGNGFLYNMVRIIAGTLLDVGRGRLSMERMDLALDEANRDHAGPTLPPQGLYLEWIRYPSVFKVTPQENTDEKAVE
jgi:tRNA pseudouridine38-40 synthase